MIRHGLVAKAGGLNAIEAPYGPIEVWREGSPLARPLAAEADVRAARSHRRAGLADDGGRCRSPSPCRRSAPRARSAPPTA